MSIVSGGHLEVGSADVCHVTELYYLNGTDRSVSIGEISTCDYDSDSDGLPDAWEYYYFGSLYYGASGDPDGDGYTNAQEYQYNMDPTQANGPLILTQPDSQCVLVGSNVTFTVTAGGLTPLKYQWWFNGASLSGKTNSTLNLTSVTTNNAGNYFVIVTNSLGSITSSVASLTVLTAPCITRQPESQCVLVGSNVTFTVTHLLQFEKLAL